jgi:hypothetical protein
VIGIMGTVKDKSVPCASRCTVGNHISAHWMLCNDSC